MKKIFKRNVFVSNIFLPKVAVTFVPKVANISNIFVPKEENISVPKVTSITCIKYIPIQLRSDLKNL